MQGSRFNIPLLSLENADALRHTQLEAKTHVAYDGAEYRAYATMPLRPRFPDYAGEKRRPWRFAIVA